MSVNVALAQALAARRPFFNGVFRRHAKGLSAPLMLAFLRRTAGPIFACAPAGLQQQALDGLFELGVFALRRKLLGSEEEASSFEQALRATMLALAPHFGGQPKRLIAALGNGYVRLARELGEPRALGWLAAMAELSDLPTGTDLLAAGLVRAWQQGMAEAREAALASASSMSPLLCERLFGTAVPDGRIERRFARPASTAPLGNLRLWTRVGGFSGIGGPFSSPPELYRIGEQIYATDGDRVRELCADVFGGRLVTAGRGALEVIEAGVQDGASVSQRGTVTWGEHSLRLPALGDASSCVACAAMVAVTLRDSHYVFVLGRPAQDHG